MAALLDRLQPRAVAIFAALTLLIWTNRIWLAWTNDEDTVARKLVWSTPITLFVLAAIAVVVTLLRGRADTAGAVRLVRVFAAGTVVYWAIRIVAILAADHEVGFKVVHTVLAVASTVAAVAAWRAVDGRRDAPIGEPATA